VFRTFFVEKVVSSNFFIAEWTPLLYLEKCEQLLIVDDCNHPLFPERYTFIDIAKFINQSELSWVSGIVISISPTHTHLFYFI